MMMKMILIKIIYSDTARPPGAREEFDGEVGFSAQVLHTNLTSAPDISQTRALPQVPKRDCCYYNSIYDRNCPDSQTQRWARCAVLHYVPGGAGCGSHGPTVAVDFANVLAPAAFVIHARAVHTRIQTYMHACI